MWQVMAVAQGSPNWNRAVQAASVQHRQYTSDVPVTTAHLLSGVDFDLAHVDRHMKAAQKSEHDPKAMAFNLEHAKGHLDSAIDHAHRLTAHLRENYPSEGKELDKVAEAQGLMPGPEINPEISGAGTNKGT